MPAGIDRTSGSVSYTDHPEVKKKKKKSAQKALTENSRKFIESYPTTKKGGY